MRGNVKRVTRTSFLLNHFHHDVFFPLRKTTHQSWILLVLQSRSFPPRNCIQIIFVGVNSHLTQKRSKNEFITEFSLNNVSHWPDPLCYIANPYSLTGSHNCSTKYTNRPLWYCFKLIPLVHLQHSLEGDDWITVVVRRELNWKVCPVEWNLWVSDMWTVLFCAKSRLKLWRRQRFKITHNLRIVRAGYSSLD